MPNYMTDPDFKFINEQMMISENPAKTFTFKTENGDQYTPERLSQIVHMLNESGYSAKIVKLPSKNNAIYVEGSPSDSARVEQEEFENEFPETISSEKHFIEIKDSDCIRSIEWDNQKLTVQFTSQNTRYSWGEVPLSVFEEFKNAPSKGRFYNTAIKDRFPEST